MNGFHSDVFIPFAPGSYHKHRRLLFNMRRLNNIFLTQNAPGTKRMEAAVRNLLNPCGLDAQHM